MRPFAQPLRLGSALALAAALAGCGPVNRGLESVHQPVVSSADYALDVTAGPRGLAPGEDLRLAGWFDALGLGYGDHVAIDDPSPYGHPGSREAVATVAARYGLLVASDVPVTAGAIAPATLRVVVSRSAAAVHDCPDWRRVSQPEFASSSMSNYGCANNSNLAAMVADPRDLVRGPQGAAVADAASAAKAIKTYREADPTGKAGLKTTESASGASEMNAPFNPRSAGVRDPFNAYVCDEATADMLRPIAVEMGWAPEKVNKGGLRNAVQSLSVSASPNILFVDLSESGDPLNDINALAEVCEPGTVVIAAGQVNDVRLYRDLVASGIQDYLLKPFSPDQMRDTLAHAQAILAGPRGSGDAGKDRPHLMTAVIGVRGGIGASSIASSLAWLLGDTAGRSTALLDLDIHFGTGALSLDLEPGRGLTDAIENPSRIDGLFIERAMVRANDKLAVLSAEAPINQPLISDGTAFYQLQEEIRGAYEHCVIDLPRPMLIQHPHLLHEVNSTVLVTEFTLAAARDAIRMLSWLKTNAPQSQVIVVANKVVTGGAPEIGRKDFEQSIERKVDLAIPADPKLAAQAAKLGKPLAEVGKGGKTGQALVDLTRLIASAAGEEATTKGDGAKSLLGRLADFKAMLPAKQKKAK